MRSAANFESATTDSTLDRGPATLDSTLADEQSTTGQRRFVVMVSGEDDHRVARASGSLFDAAADLVEIVVGHLVRHGCQQILLDMGAVTSVEVGALRSLHAYRRALTETGVLLVFANFPLAS